MLTFGNTYLNFGGAYLKEWYKEENPLNLPKYTIRVLYKDNTEPTEKAGTSIEQISTTPNIWDINGNPFGSWNSLLRNEKDLLSVLGGNSYDINSFLSMFEGCSSLSSVANFNIKGKVNRIFTNCDSLTIVPNFNMNGVYSMVSMFQGCTSLTNIPKLNTINVSSMQAAFFGCTNLKNIPDLDTSNLANSDFMFASCYNVSGGILDFYNKLNNQFVPPYSHSRTFWGCGKNSQTGSAELAQIPSDWK